MIKSEQKPQRSNSCRWIEDDFGAIQREHHPILWMMTTVTDVDTDFAYNLLIIVLM